MNFQKLKAYWFALYLIAFAFGVGWLVKTYYLPKVSTVPSTQATLAPQTKLDKEILSYQQKIAADPKDTKTLLLLANDYMQKLRETADPSYYTKIDSLTAQAEKLEPQNGDVYFIEGAVALSRHHFIDALALGQKAVNLNPSNAIYYGVIADAQTELGKNDEAVKTLQTMVDMKPDYSAFSRIAYARELHGDISGAEQAIKMAVDAGSTFAENQAWGYNELGKLYEREDLKKAQEQFNLALQIVPRYAPALEQQAKIAFVRGDSQKALTLLNQAIDVVPLVQYYIDLGEVYAREGNQEKAAQQYELAKIGFQKTQQGNANTDMENSLFLSEHDLDLKQALSLAQASFMVRGSIFGADALAWANYKNNNLTDALKYAKAALRLGEFDPGIVFHMAQIQEAAGNLAEARRLYQKVIELNPDFSILYSGIAEDKLKQ